MSQKFLMIIYMRDEHVKNVHARQKKTTKKKLHWKLTVRADRLDGCYEFGQRVCFTQRICDEANFLNKFIQGLKLSLKSSTSTSTVKNQFSHVATFRTLWGMTRPQKNTLRLGYERKFQTSGCAAGGWGDAHNTRPLELPGVIGPTKQTVFLWHVHN